MNVALALLFILQLHSIQLQLISVTNDYIQIKMMLEKIHSICDKVFKNTKRTTNLRNNVEESLRHLEKINETLKDFTDSLNDSEKPIENLKDTTELKNIMELVKKIEQNIANAEKPIDNLISLMNNIRNWMKRLISRYSMKENIIKLMIELELAAYHLNLMDATVQHLQIEMQTSKKKMDTMPKAYAGLDLKMDTMPKTLGDLYNDIDKMESKPLMAINDLNAAIIRLNAAMEYGKMIDSLLSNFNNTFQNLQNGDGSADLDEFHCVIVTFGHLFNDF
ncbi:hypothetical protein EWB00_003333 [Schistosoma japonicum]|uniref:Uncharacterized protein n=1 Tax=Schistosoma japonicum TaxID=6182 RepID=A0A4Z2D9N4_SCHJA|nr:hypothetical protein EWB00_003333 [Schistosoma japonicum]